MPYLARAKFTRQQFKYNLHWRIFRTYLFLVAGNFDSWVTGQLQLSE
jgi:hypothetical protein